MYFLIFLAFIYSLIGTVLRGNLTTALFKKSSYVKLLLLSNKFKKWSWL